MTALDTLQIDRLSRAAYAERTGRAETTPPVRIVHLGLGAYVDDGRERGTVITTDLPTVEQESDRGDDPGRR